MQDKKTTVSSRDQSGGITAHTVNASKVSSASLTEKKTPLKTIGIVVGIFAGIVAILAYFGIVPLINN